MRALVSERKSRCQYGAPTGYLVAAVFKSVVLCFCTKSRYGYRIRCLPSLVHLYEIVAPQLNSLLIQQARSTSEQHRELSMFESIAGAQWTPTRAGHESSRKVSAEMSKQLRMPYEFLSDFEMEALSSSYPCRTRGWNLQCQSIWRENTAWA